MSVPSSSMTYHLQGGDIVEARVSSSPADVASAKLHWLGVQVFRTRAGGVMGQVSIEPAALEALEGVRLERLQRFKVISQDALQLLPPSPLSRCRPIRFIDAQSHEELVHHVQMAWAEVVRGARATLDQARGLAQDAHLLMDPWRIEGTVRVGNEEVRVLFSAAGDRACICGLNGRALVVQPLNPRIILPVHNHAPRDEQEQLWRAAIEQARTCLGAQPEPVSEQMSLSIDLASQDLEASYERNHVAPASSGAHAGPPGMVGPGQAAAPPVITGVGEQPPPRMPPPRAPSHVSTAASRAPLPQSILRSVPPPIAGTKGGDSGSLDLGSLDLSSEDLSLDLASVDLDSMDLPD